eukprot:GAFH01003692.1.p2 GENE.GAFH01003692.1~~GAFH01003692.1.p2  ORF type:complete len:156 (-),score=0.59 GAFH01003692.1:214-681(-)
MRERWGSSNPGWLQGMADDARDEDGINFRWSPIYSNSLYFHALMEFAWQTNPAMQHTLARTIMTAYYTQGVDVTPIDTLVRFAEQCGYSGDAARAALTRPSVLQETNRLCGTIARRYRIQGVPHIVIGSRVLSGAASSPHLVRLINEQLARSTSE